MRARFAHLKETWQDSKAREALGKADLPALVSRFIPILFWFPKYPRSWFQADAIGGLTTWAGMIPSAMAYAQLAGVPAQYGLYAAMAAMAVYPLFATSRHVRVTTSSTMAVMSAAMIAPLVLAGGGPLALTAALALVVGLLLVVAGFLRLGFLGDFLSKPVITGFLFGLGINIIVGQLPKLMGIPPGGRRRGSLLDHPSSPAGAPDPWTLDRRCVRRPVGKHRRSRTVRRERRRA